MPSHEEHCLHSLKRYGIRGDDIHSWMDEPSQVSGATHRKFRHDLKSLPIAIKIFGKKYGDEMVENIFLDHLKADSEEDRLKALENQPEHQQGRFDGVIPENTSLEAEPDHHGKLDSIPLPHKSTSNQMGRAEKLLIVISVGISFLILIYVLINAFGHPLGLW